jgi:hypothetical protein
MNEYQLCVTVHGRLQLQAQFQIELILPEIEHGQIKLFRLRLSSIVRQEEVAVGEIHLMFMHMAIMLGLLNKLVKITMRQIQKLSNALTFRNVWIVMQKLIHLIITQYYGIVGLSTNIQYGKLVSMEDYLAFNK